MPKSRPSELGHQRRQPVWRRASAQITLDYREVDLEQVDHLQRDADPLARDRQLQRGEELAAASVRGSLGAPAIPWRYQVARIR